MDGRRPPNDRSEVTSYYQPPDTSTPQSERSDLMQHDTEHSQAIDHAIRDRKRYKEEAIQRAEEARRKLAENSIATSIRRDARREGAHTFLETMAPEAQPGFSQTYNNIPSADYIPLHLNETQITNIQKTIETNVEPPQPTKAEPLLKRLDKQRAYEAGTEREYLNDQKLRTLLQDEIIAEQNEGKEKPVSRYLPDLLRPQEIEAIETIQREQMILAPEHRLSNDEIEKLYLQSIDVMEETLRERYKTFTNMEYTLPTPLLIQELQKKIQVAKHLQLKVDKDEVVRSLGAGFHNLLGEYDPNNPERYPEGYMSQVSEAIRSATPTIDNGLDKMHIKRKEGKIGELRDELAQQEALLKEKTSAFRNNELPRTFMFYYGILSSFISMGFTRSFVAPFERLQIMRQVIPNTYDFTQYRNGMYMDIDYKAQTPPLPPLRHGKQHPPRRFFPVFSPYHRLHTAIRHIRQHEGYLGLFRGHGSFLIRLAMFSVVQAFTYEAFAKMYRVNTILAPNNMKPQFDDLETTSRAKELLRLQKEQQTRHIVALSFATALTTVICYPLELPRLYLALQMGPRQSLHYPNTRSVLKTVFRIEGIRGLFRGTLASVLTAVPLIGLNHYLTQISAQAIYLYFGKYNVKTDHNMLQEYRKNVREARRSRKAEPRLPLTDRQLMYTQVSSTVFAMATSGLILYPLDTIRRRIQLSGPVGRLSLYHGIVTKPKIRACATEIWKSEGLFGFYKGFSMLLMKTIPLSALTFGIGAMGFNLIDKRKKYPTQSESSRANI